MSLTDKPLAWLHGEVKTPPFSQAARLEAGYLLRRLQQGESLGLPQSRPMPTIGVGCHELRVEDAGRTWRIVYYVAPDAIVHLGGIQQEDQDNPANGGGCLQAQAQGV